jgi:hypothetical protein
MDAIAADYPGGREIGLGRNHPAGGGELLVDTSMRCTQEDDDMPARRVILALPAALFLALASAPTHASGYIAAAIEPDQVACTIEGPLPQSCGGQRCLYVEQWIGARITGPTFPTTCRQRAMIERPSVG